MTIFRDIIFPDTYRANSGARSQIQASNPHINLPNRQRFVVQRYEEMFRELTMSFIQDISTADLKTVARIFNIVGTEHTFLAKDHADWNSTDGFMEDGDESLIAFGDQPMRNTVTGLFTGDGSTTTFYVGKQYSEGSGTRFKRIREPIESSLVIGIDGSPLGGSPNFTLGDNGLVTFSEAPGSGLSVTAGFTYYLPVYFPNDKGFNVSMAIKHVREFRSLVLREDLIAD